MLTALIGDIHGCRRTLERLLGSVKSSADRFVFLGDYVDRGPNSRGVLDVLIEFEAQSQTEVVFLRGNHDQMLLRLLEDDVALPDFLRMGGAPTIRSYVKPPYQDVLSQLRTSIPDSHRRFLTELSADWTDGEILAVHDARDAQDWQGFVVAGHAAQTNLSPSVGEDLALIDTGCGTVQDGRLTCFYYPTKEWVQSAVIDV